MRPPKNSRAVAASPKIALALCWLLLWVATGCARPAPSERPLLVFAAASLADAMTEIAAGFEARTGAEVDLSFAGSSTLARQVEAGAPADLLLSASFAQVERLAAAGRVRAEESFPFAANTLVVVARRGRQEPLTGAADLLRFERLALADPSAVPAGVYARHWLEAEGLWAELEARVVPTLDVRAALAAVAAGNVPVGIVYATDAAVEPRVEVLYEVPERSGDPASAAAVRYWAVPVTRPEPHPERAAFLDELRGAEAARVLAKYGFRPIPKSET
jgi:molybdate transport system substrate-binding protein